MKWQHKRTKRMAMRIGNQARDLRDWKAAAEGFRSALCADLYDSAVWVQYGNMLKEAGEIVAAEHAYRIAIEDAPANADTHVQLGHALKLLGRTEEMEHAYRQALVIDPSINSAKEELDRLGVSRTFPTAVESPRSHKQLFASTRLRRNNLTSGDRAMFLRSWEQALMHYQVVLNRKPALASILVQYGHALKELGRLNEAASAYARAVAADPQDGDANLHLSRALVQLSAPKKIETSAIALSAPSLMTQVTEVGFAEFSNAEAKKEPLSLMENNIHGETGVGPDARIRDGGSDRFDPDWYVVRYPDVADARIDPLLHFLKHGKSEGRAPNKEACEATKAETTRFDAGWYLTHYPDIATAQVDPLKHFLEHGRLEGRASNRDDYEARVANATRFDAQWYLTHYPDVATAQVDPLKHFLEHGELEGRAPNNDAYKAAEADAIGFDADWYLSYYSDVATAQVDPLKHFLEEGRHEGRAPNKREFEAADAAGFDASWYRAHYTDVALMGLDPLTHFLSYGRLEGRAPSEKHYWQSLSEDLDIAWYLERNQDVGRSEEDALFHYLNYGVHERRRPNANAPLLGVPVTDARLECLKEPERQPGEVALVVTHSLTGHLKPHVRHYLESLKHQAIAAILIVMTDKPFVELNSSLLKQVAGLFVRENYGYDFAAWAHILRIYPHLFDSSILYLTNDSVFGPLNKTSFEQMLFKLRGNTAEFIGLTEDIQRTRHLQSYFLACKAGVLSHTVFRDFFYSVVAFQHKDDVVNEYETQLTNILKLARVRCDALFPFYNAENPTLHQWRELVDQGFPFVKVSTLRGSNPGVSKSGWRTILSARGYDVTLADSTLSELAAGTSYPARTLQDAKKNFRQQALAELHAFFAGKGTLKLPLYKNPVLSILIVVYNEAELTLRCLKSIVETVDVPAEVIIVDNASSDDTADLFDRLEGARIYRNLEDLHFLRAANQGAARANGRTLLLINNDACLTPGAIKFGLETLDSADDIGAVGAKLILPNGTLQEAGSIIWTDAATLGYGRGCDPNNASFQFRREVDYCSGAYMLLRRDVFELLGRFDPVFAPAYYEETDLCMRIRDAGYRIMYDPRIKVIHYEFASAAFSNEAYALMTRNRGLFTQRNAASLAKRHLGSDTPLIVARLADRWRPRILMIENMIPFTHIGAGFPRADRILRSLVEAGYFVTYYPSHQNEADWTEIHENFPVDVEFVIGADRLSLEAFLAERVDYYAAMVVCRPNNMEFIGRDVIQHPERYREVAIIYDAEALVTPREIMRLELAGTPMIESAKKIAQQVELDLTRTADAVIAVNNHEAGVFQLAGHQNVHILGHAIEAQPTDPEVHSRRDFLLVGALHHDVMPNVDALLWFVEQVMPKLDQLIGPRYRLYVAGTLGSERLKKPLSSRLILLGRVDDLTDFYQRARVFVAPTRYAAGIPLKILEAASRGLPTVATSLLADQLGWTAGRELLTGDTPDTFAAECARLYLNDDVWLQVRQQSLSRVSLDCDPGRFTRGMIEVMRSVRVFPVDGRLQGRLSTGVLLARNSERLKSVADTSVLNPVVTLPEINHGVLTVDVDDSSADNRSSSNSAVLLQARRALNLNIVKSGCAIVYLAYGADESCFSSFERFISSYQTFAAGIPHALYVAMKCFRSPEDLMKAEALFASVGGKVIHMDNDGLDLGAYILAAQKVTEKHICFMNHYSEVLAEGWLEKMDVHLRRPEVGLVGATGSFERLAHPSIAFPQFPNPHLRTNGFMMDNDLFQTLMADVPLETKEDTYLVESGPDSLTRRVIACGLDVLVVGRNGRAYPQRWWPCSDTFRQGNQSNLLIGDNRTRDFQIAQGEEKLTLLQFAWGTYLDSADVLTSSGGATGDMAA